jgi:glycosyltransferase involved in cell wall biosynthesis
MKPRPVVHCDHPVHKPKLSIILIDWAARESFHSLHYLNRQTVPREEYELLWVEFHDHRPEELSRMVGQAAAAPLLDRWITLGYPREMIYHKHRLYNVGILASRGDVCVICDSDAIFSPTFVENLIKAYQQTPDAVVHLDEVRTNSRNFYPFNYPTIEEVLAAGCFNWTGTTTTGLSHNEDRPHKVNIGACMAARRRDMLAIGGADEHIDYLGYMCGPYEMTFRLVNHQARPALWLTNEYLYHTWHPNTSGTNTEYCGPEDGRLMSLRALDALSRCRIPPYQRSPLMGPDLVRRPPDLPRVLSVLAERPEPAWLRNNAPTAPPDYVYIPLRHPFGFNYFWHQGRWYALPEREGELDLDRARSGGYEVLYTGGSEEEVEGQVHASPLRREPASLGRLGRMMRTWRAHSGPAIPGRVWRKSCNLLRRVIPPLPLWQPSSRRTNFPPSTGPPAAETTRTSEMKVTLLALTLNEIEGVKAVLPNIPRDCFHQVLILDGGSTDGTVEWARDHGYTVYSQRRPGIRFAYLEALPFIEGDVILSFSPDGNCDPAVLPRIIDKMREGYDLVIGSRYLKGVRSEDDDVVTAFGNWLFTRTVNLLYGARYSDVMVIYRAFTKSLIYELGLDQEGSYTLPEKMFRTVISWEPLMSVRAAKYGKRIGEVPAGEPKRIGGKRKLQILRWGAAYYFQIWKERIGA